MQITGRFVTASRYLKILLVIFTLMTMPSYVVAAGFIQTKGSDTEVNVVQRLAEAYMKSQPNVMIAVTGGGSGVGIAAIINKTTDITNSSRAMTETEIAQAKANGVHPVPVVFAMDGLAVIVNQANTVKSLTLEQLGQIYRGDIKNWSQVGGPNFPVTLYGRQPNSGTFVFFRDVVIKSDYSNSMNQMNGNAQIVEAVKRDKGGIGYVGIGYAVGRDGRVVSGLKVPDVARAKKSPAVSPINIKNIASGAYPIVRPLYQYFGHANRQKVAGFIKFELGPQGQQIISREGFYPISEQYRKFNATYGF